MPGSVSAIADIRLDGGLPCLDFVNTVHDRTRESMTDYLSTPEQLLAWAVRAGLVEAGENLAVPAQASCRAQLMKDVRKLREAIHALFSAKLDRSPVPPAALALLDKWVHAAWKDTVLCSPSLGRVCLRNTGGGVGVVLMRAALNALEALRGGEEMNLKRCPECGWLFLDTSKNGSRRWCAMQTCGATVKMRRYRGRERKET